LWFATGMLQSLARIRFLSTKGTSTENIYTGIRRPQQIDFVERCSRDPFFATVRDHFAHLTEMRKETGKCMSSRVMIHCERFDVPTIISSNIGIGWASFSYSLASQIAKAKSVHVRIASHLRIWRRYAFIMHTWTRHIVCDDAVCTLEVPECCRLGWLMI